MPVESATFIDELNPAWPPGGDPKSEGDNHFRLIKEVLQNSFAGAEYPRALRAWADKEPAVELKLLDYTAVVGDDGKLFVCDAAAGELTLQLPAAALSTEVVLWVKKIDSSGNNVVIDGAGATIDGALSVILDTQYAFRAFWCDGTDWHVVCTSAGAGGGGVTDHGALTGLADDDHVQYHNNTRGDARYYTQSAVDTALAGKSDVGHGHDDSEIAAAASATNYTPADATVEGHLSGIDAALGGGGTPVIVASPAIASTHGAGTTSTDLSVAGVAFGDAVQLVLPPEAYVNVIEISRVVVPSAGIVRVTTFVDGVSNLTGLVGNWTVRVWDLTP